MTECRALGVILVTLILINGSSAEACGVSAQNLQHDPVVSENSIVLPGIHLSQSDILTG
jgi:hypothetical protein